MRNPIMLAAVVIALALLTYLTISYDYQIFSAIRGIQNPVIDAVMLAVTNLATLYIGVPVILILVYFTRQRKILWDLVPALAIGIVLVLILKMAIARPRPEDILNVSFWASAGFQSFPSDHACTAFVMFGAIGHRVKKYRLWFYLLAVLIGLSRVYLGVHYPTDVLAGAFIGILVSQMVIKYELGSRLRKAFRKR